MQNKFITKGREETIRLASNIGKNLKGGEIFTITSDLGGGKTTFTKGLVLGSGSKDNVTSPSFNIKNEYKNGKFNIYHYDFYRLNNDPGLMKNELDEAINEKDAVIILEWSESVRNILPADIIEIDIKVNDENIRQFSFNFPPKYTYLFN